MKYYAVKFKISCETELKGIAGEMLAAMAGEAGFESFEDTDDGINGYVQTELFDRAALDEAIEVFPLDGARITYEVEDVEDRNWNEEWENAGFEPIIIDGRCVIHDSMHAIGNPGYDMDITIEARQAFGTGTHETTRMVSRYILGQNLEGKRVLDCGCGTGILSIIASKQGAEEVVGYDIDEWSVENTMHNAKLNDVGNIEVLHGDASVVSHISGIFDLVLANINRNILLADMETMRSTMGYGSTLVLSGFYKEDADLLTEKAKELGMERTGGDEENDWCMLVFTVADA